MILLLAARFGGIEIQPIVAIVAGGLAGTMIDADPARSTAGRYRRSNGSSEVADS
ncbi:hypothetical protein [Frankia gtarii]|uniref:hypothetical protein n=1 Tax=Frankia gtarii TaxID=2950102 RepID=UPI0021C22960|nr:hypothetical protein [Frankia gtarii]